MSGECDDCNQHAMDCQCKTDLHERKQNNEMRTPMIREEQPDDQEKVERAIEKINILYDLYPEFEPVIWISAFWTLTVRSCVNTGLPYEVFKNEIYKMVEFYKDKFEN